MAALPMMMMVILMMVLLPYSQAKVTGPYPQPDESNPYSPTLFH
jgi:hypothetical protein